MSDTYPQSDWRSKWRAVSRAQPCPVCKKPDNCKITLDGGAVFCGRVKSDRPPNAGGQHLHILSDSSGYTHPVLGDAPPPANQTSSQSKSSQPKNWEKNTGFFVAKVENRLSELASDLGVCIEALRGLQVGMTNAYGRDCWTFPEKNAKGDIIGIVLRDFGIGKKRCMSGSKRGLIYADNWHKTDGPIYLVEGASDTAALMTMGLCTIGRPSNRGGVEYLAALLKSYRDRDIIILGERDKKEDTGTWPGREGAIATAKQLSERLDRTVNWALPPKGFKDVREYLNGPDSKPSWSLDLETIQPPPPPEPFLSPTGSIISLEDLRKDLAVTRHEILRKPGLYFDGSPTGAGKSTADRVAMREVSHSLTLVPTHTNGDELLAELKKAGFDHNSVAKLPARASPAAVKLYFAAQEKRKGSGKKKTAEWIYGICNNMEGVKQAESYGLSAGAAVCPSCPYRNDCNFLEEREIAMNAPHLIATHHMLAMSAGDLAKDRKFVSIHEDPTDMLSPMLRVHPDKLDWVESVAAEGSWLEKQGHAEYINVQTIEVYDLIADTVRELKSKAQEAEKITKFVPRKVLKLPPEMQRQIMQASVSLDKRVKQKKVECPTKSANAMRLVLGLISGKIHSCAIRVTSSYKSGRIGKEVIGVRKTNLPADATVLFSDATGNVDLIKLHTGRPVQDITPDGLLRPKHPLIQITRDIKRSTQDSAVTRILAAVMVKHPEAQQIGIIGHKQHVEFLVGQNAPLGSLSARIKKTAYFGQGTDRASNGWYQSCDLLVILGTPRVPSEAILDELIRIEDLEAAQQDGQWEARRWEAETPSGLRRIVKGSGYTHPSWRNAYEAVVKANLLQAVGRARSNQDDGIPAVVLSNEPLGLPVEDEENAFEPLSGRALKLLIWIEDQISKSVSKYIKTFGNFETRQIAAGMKISSGETSKALSELTAAGYLTKLGHGRWAVSRQLSQPGLSMVA